MSLGDTAGDLRDTGVLDLRQAGPTVLRMLVGTQLRQRREARRVSRADAGEAIRCSHSKISRLELGRTGFKARDVADLLTLYGVEDEAERSSLLELARRANEPSWWHPYADVVPGWFESYLGIEQAASAIRGYEVQVIPGLLQTQGYADAVIRLAHGDAPELEIERRIDLRMRRQRILSRPEPVALWVVIDEAALRRPIGGAVTMRAQLTHLIEVAERPNVSVQVLPFAAGGHPAAGGPVTILRLPQGELSDVVYLEQLTSAHYPDKEAEIEHYRHIMNEVSIQAARPDMTPTILRRIREET
jgi:transcriptional regulator with XRE-family HTH domain